VHVNHRDGYTSTPAMSSHKSKRKLRQAASSPVEDDVADAQRRLTRRKGDSDDMDYQPSEKSADEPGSAGSDEDEKHHEFAVPVPKYKGLQVRPIDQPSGAPSGVWCSTGEDEKHASPVTKPLRAFASSDAALSANDVMAANFPNFYTHVDLNKCQLGVDVVGSGGAEKVYAHVTGFGNERDLTVWTPVGRVSFPMVYPYGNHQATNKPGEYLGTSPENTYYTLTFGTTPAWEADRRTAHNQDPDALGFCQWLERLNARVSDQIIVHPRYGAAVREQGGVKAMEELESKIAFLIDQGKDDESERVRQASYSEDDVTRNCRQKLVRSCVALRKESKKAVQERIKSAVTQADKSTVPRTTAHTESVRIRSRVFKKVYPDKVEDLKKKIASHPVVKAAYEQGYDLVDLPMYDAATLHQRDGQGRPIPIPAPKRMVRHNDLVSLALKLVPCDYTPQRKGCGLVIQLTGIIFFRHGGMLDAGPPLRDIPVFAFNSSAAPGFDPDAASQALTEIREPEDEEDDMAP
jgi:hypothetical protein